MVGIMSALVVRYHEAHLPHVLRAYADYYTGGRTHLPLGKDTSLSRPIQRQGHLQSVPHLGGLHYAYARI